MQAGELERLRKQVELHSEDAELRHELAEALLASGEVHEAIKEFQAVIDLGPDDDWLMGHAHLQLGYEIANQGNVEAAIRHFQEALRFRPGHVSAHHLLAVLPNAKGSRAQARKHWEAVVAARERGEVPELYQVTEARRLLAEFPPVLPAT